MTDLRQAWCRPVNGSEFILKSICVTLVDKTVGLQHFNPKTKPSNDVKDKIQLKYEVNLLIYEDWVLNNSR